jgi:putative copper resistance protein D
MAGHDHGELSVAVLVDGERFHVPGPVAPGSAVTVFNSGDTDVTLTADDGGFDVVVPGHTLLTFPAPTEPGEHPFGSRHDPAFRDVLVVAAPGG